MILTGTSASRQHATINLGQDRAILADQSPNGTWLRLGGDPPMRLLREAAVPIRRGTITIGADPARDEMLPYRCV